MGWAARLKAGQSMSYIDHFLHLETGAGAEPLPGTLRRFVTAAPWIGRNADSPLVRKLGEHYVNILGAIASRELTAFAAAQPEANIDGFLSPGSFPADKLLQQLYEDHTQEITDLEIQMTTRGLKMTVTMISVIPILCVYPFMQRFLIKGIMVGAVKG